jgi:hypothetical protein
MILSFYAFVVIDDISESECFYYHNPSLLQLSFSGNRKKIVVKEKGHHLLLILKYIFISLIIIIGEGKSGG